MAKMSKQNEHRPKNKDKVISDSGWGIKPDDQPANAGATGAEGRQYHYDPQEEDAVRKILRQMRLGFNTPDRILVEPGKTTIYDLNGDGFEVHGLSFSSKHLVELLQNVGAGFDPQQLRGLPKDYDGVREYTATRSWAWGAERTG